MTFHFIPCINIRPDPQSAGYEPHQLEELASSIRHFGVLRPVLLRKIPGGYVLVHGERRWRAALAIGVHAIPAYIVEDARPAGLPEALPSRPTRAVSLFPVPGPSNGAHDYADWDE